MSDNEHIATWAPRLYALVKIRSDVSFTGANATVLNQLQEMRAIGQVVHILDEKHVGVEFGVYPLVCFDIAELEDGAVQWR